jgi:hypothetical protein
MLIHRSQLLKKRKEKKRSLEQDLGHFGKVVDSARGALKQECFHRGCRVDLKPVSRIQSKSDESDNKDGHIAYSMTGIGVKS